MFLPVLTLTGLQGSFFGPLARSYIIAILASLATALTVTPALTLVFFSRHTKEEKAPRLQSLLRGLYEKILGGVTRATALDVAKAEDVRIDVRANFLALWVHRVVASLHF